MLVTRANLNPVAAAKAASGAAAAAAHQRAAAAAVKKREADAAAKKREAIKANKKRSTEAKAAVLKRKAIVPRPDILHTYLGHRQVNQYLEYLTNRYGHFVKMHTLGYSHEKREVRGIEINWMNEDNTELTSQTRPHSSPSLMLDESGANQLAKSIKDNERSCNICFIEAGTHAREWITVATALNCIYQLTECYSRNVEVLRKLRFFIVPLVNPDGYEYSRNKNRKWRKNRRPHKQNKFVGTDCNRNYDICWETAPNRVNRNTFKGEKPFSEPETRAVRNILEKLQSNLLFFLSLHSCSQSIMYPWGYSKEPTEYWRELNTLALAGRNAIKSYNGREYKVGSISQLTKRTISGSVVDYVYGILKVPMALVMELPSQELGFQPPVEMISQIGHESWFGIREMCKRSYDLRPQINRGEERAMPSPLFVPEKRISAGASDSKPSDTTVPDTKLLGIKPKLPTIKPKPIAAAATTAYQTIPKPKPLERRTTKTKNTTTTAGAASLRKRSAAGTTATGTSTKKKSKVVSRLARNRRSNTAPPITITTKDRVLNRTTAEKGDSAVNAGGDGLLKSAHKPAQCSVL